jgi:hypothetical protein
MIPAVATLAALLIFGFWFGFHFVRAVRLCARDGWRRA